MEKKIKIFLLLSIGLSSLIAEPIQIIPQEGSLSSQLGRKFGEGLGKALAEQIPKEIEHQKELWEAHAQNRLIEALITHYEPKRHTHCISVVLKSQLSDEMKRMVVEHLNQLQKDYIKNGF